MATTSRSHELLQANIVNLFAKGILTDVVLVSEEGKEVNGHRAILAAHSGFFRDKFMQSSAASFPVPIPVTILHHLMKFLYFHNYDESITPEVALGVLREARNLRIDAILSDDIAPLITPQLNIHNCLSVLTNTELEKHPAIAAGVCDFVAASMLDLLSAENTFRKMLQVPKSLLLQLISRVARVCTTNDDADTVTRFVVEWARAESACDLLKECKQWEWGDSSKPTLMRESLSTEPSEEWYVPGVKKLLANDLPVRYVAGEFFDWCVRLDHGAEGKLRIVYESATEIKPTPDACLVRFPAAMFAWQVIYRGQNVFHERPVFICFPQNASLHWSTTLPVFMDDLADDDEITILCTMVENPLVSLILYHFSSDLATTVKNEDILNRLPHIEFRCVSSYMLFQNHNLERDS